MLDLICAQFEFFCEAIKTIISFNLPQGILYFVIGLFAIYGLFNFLANAIPQVETIKSKIYLPIVKKLKLKALSNQAIKADIRGSVNSAISKFSDRFPNGWLKPMDIKWVQHESKDDFLSDNEIVIRLRPVEDQKINFINAVYYFLRKSFFPKTKKVVPETYREASVLFTSVEIIKDQKPELMNLFNDHILEPEVDRDNKLLEVMDRYKKIDEHGFFTGAFLREIHAVASEVKLSSLRNKMRQEVNEIIKHIEEFLDLYKKSQVIIPREIIPDDKWHRKGPVTNYGFLLVAQPLKVERGERDYVNRAHEKIDKGINRLYVFGTYGEKDFANRVIYAISKKVPGYQLSELFTVAKDYRGNAAGGIGALFVKI